MSTPSSLNQAAVALGRRGGVKSSSAKTRAAKKNAPKAPKPGKQLRGRPFNNTKLVEVFGDDSASIIAKIIKGGITTSTTPPCKERFKIALQALQTLVKTWERMYRGYVITAPTDSGGITTQDRTSIKVAYYAMRLCKPEVDAIMQYAHSHDSGKTIPELELEDVCLLRPEPHNQNDDPSDISQYTKIYTTRPNKNGNKLAQLSWDRFTHAAGSHPRRMFIEWGGGRAKAPKWVASITQTKFGCARWELPFGNNNAYCLADIPSRFETILRNIVRRHGITCATNSELKAHFAHAIATGVMRKTKTQGAVYANVPIGRCGNSTLDSIAIWANSNPTQDNPQ